jgi:outer membrane protein OmpA-like peptidoglycan-associated protein
MFRKVASALALFALVISGLVATPSAAGASGSSTDATLSELRIEGNGSNWNDRYETSKLWPSFDKDQLYYEAFSTLTSVDFFISTNDPSATATISGGDASNRAVTSGAATTLEFEAKPNNLVTITVTAGDGQTKRDYKVNMSNRFLPTPEVLSVAPTSFSTGGGDTSIAYIKHAFNGSGCYTSARAEYNYIDSDGVQQREEDYISDGLDAPDASGVTKLRLQSDGLYSAFRKVSTVADFKLGLSCYMWDPISANWREQVSGALLPGTFTYYNPEVTSVSLPETISQRTVFKLFGPGINDDAYLDIYILDPVSGRKLHASTNWINDSSLMGTFGGWDTNPEWKSAKTVKFIVDHYNYDDDDEYVRLYSKDLKFTPRMASRVTMTPSKGSVFGGNTVKISGFMLCNDSGIQPVITIGGKPVTDLTQVQCDSYRSSNGEQYDGLDRYTFTAPSGVAGSADVVIDIGFGPTTISQKYVYGAKPVVSSVSPSTVSNTGGSLITINGSGFGNSGTPVVTIEGEKALWVQRISDSKLIAMVPASSTIGSVELNVVSSTGGGALDVPASLTYSSTTSNPTVSTVAPNSSSVSGGDSVVITGTGFAAGSTGVLFNGVPAKVTASTTTSISVEVPSADAPGAIDVVVATPTGKVTKSAAFTYKANPGVTSVAPAVIKSTDTGAATKVTVNGFGFGTKGTIKVGSATAVAYTSNGTSISGVTIPTSKAGAVALVITPSGAKSSFTTSVTVREPKISYIGPDPFNEEFTDTDPFTSQGGSQKASSRASGGDVIRIEGTGFGTSGKVKFGSVTVTPTSYSDTVVVFTTPAIAAGTYDLSVVPSTGTLTATRKSAVDVGVGGNMPVITEILSQVDNARSAARNTFAPAEDASDVFVVKGTGFLSTDNGAATTIRILKQFNYSDWLTLTPVSVTDTQVVVRMPRNLEVLNWYTVRVETKTSYVQQQLGVFVTGVAPTPTTMTPAAGLCTKESIGTYIPAVITATGDGVFGATGTVKFGGVTLPAGAVSWTANSVAVELAKQSANLANPWGSKEISFIPSDSSLPAQNWTFRCGVSTDVTTKLNNATSDLTVAAGTAYTASATLNNALPATSYTQPADGYSYQSVDDYNANAFRQGVRSGLPVAAGTWYVFANIGSATFDADKYVSITNQNAVKINITGTSVTFTPKLATGSGDTIEYRGQLGDGTDGSPNDITYTATATNDAVTGVTWQYRNHLCALANPSNSWNSGLPNSPAIAESWCGGDDASVTSWEIRVASFEMKSGNVDRSIYYLPTYETFLLTITKKALTINAIKAEKVYDGNTSISLGEITTTGAVEGDQITLDWNYQYGFTFADATAGLNKTLTNPNPLMLDWNWRNKYSITNPEFAPTGSILKADALLKLTASPGSVVLANNTPIELTVESRDTRTGQLQPVEANAATPVLVNKTPSICSLNGTSVTALAVGECVIEATQAASENYNAAKSFKDDSQNVEQLVINVYGSPKSLSVIADDLVVAIGETIVPSYSMAGLIEGDAYDGVEFDYYSGATLLASVPTEPGTYKIVPKAGMLAAIDDAAYSNLVKYVVGKLIITPAPPTISATSPNSGPEAGGNTVVISGTGLDQVTSIVIGAVTIRKANFVVNGDGTTISFKMPAGTGEIKVTLVAGLTELQTDYTYVANPVPNAPSSIKLTLKLEIGAKFYGQKVTIKGGGLKPNSLYTLVMRSNPVTIYKANTDANGNFLNTIKIPSKACLAPGKHSFTLTGTTPDGKKATDTAYFVLSDKCVVAAQATKTSTKSWTLNGFLFDFCQPALNKGGYASLKALAPLIKGAKSITVYGYTETDTKSAAIKRANIVLAQGRTNSVVAYLKKLGVKAVYKTVAKGGVDPVSVTQQWKNRRVVIEATY